MRLCQRYGVLDEVCKLLRCGWSYDDAQIRKDFLSPGRNSSVVLQVVLLLQLSAYTAAPQLDLACVSFKQYPSLQSLSREQLVE